MFFPVWSWHWKIRSVPSGNSTPNQEKTQWASEDLLRAVALMRMIWNDKRHKNTWDIRMQCWGFKSTLTDEKEEAGITQTHLQSWVSWRNTLHLRSPESVSESSIFLPSTWSRLVHTSSQFHFHSCASSYTLCTYAYLSITAGQAGSGCHMTWRKMWLSHVFVHLIWGLFRWSARCEHKKGI